VGDKIEIETKGGDVIRVTYTDQSGKSVNLDHVKAIQTYRTASAEGNADKVQLTLVPDSVEWAVELGDGEVVRTGIVSGD
jgi:hypothetical protein